MHPSTNMYHVPMMSQALTEKLDHCPSGRNGFPERRANIAILPVGEVWDAMGHLSKLCPLKPVGRRPGFLEGN